MLNSDDIRVVFLTAENCGHCITGRGDGVLNSKNKVLVSSNFITKLISGKMKLINIHYHNMMATKNSIKSLTKFYIKDKIVYQEKYDSFQDETRKEIYKETKEGAVRIFNDFIKDNKTKQKVTWRDFINNEVPTKILNYVFFFPCYLVLDKNNWKNCLLDSKEELVALTNAGFTRKDKYGNIGMEKTQQSIYGRNVDITKLISDVLNGTVKIEVNKVEEKEEVKEEKKKKKKVKFDMSEFIEYKDVVVKGYDD